MNKKENINMKNYNSKENKYTDIKSSDILERAKHCQHLYSGGMSVKRIAEKYNLSESRIRQYLKK
jgi:DNA-binding NarL/FixJ family response regulator